MAVAWWRVPHVYQTSHDSISINNNILTSPDFVSRRPPTARHCPEAEKNWYTGNPKVVPFRAICAEESNVNAINIAK